MFSYRLFNDSLPRSRVLTTVNLNIVVSIAALLLIALCGQCIGLSPIVRLYSFGRTHCPGCWLIASPLSLRTKRKKICSHMYTPIGTRTSDSSVRAAEDNTHFNSCGECESDFFITRYSLLQHSHESATPILSVSLSSVLGILNWEQLN